MTIESAWGPNIAPMYEKLRWQMFWLIRCSKKFISSTIFNLFYVITIIIIIVEAGKILSLLFISFEIFYY